MLKGVAGMSPSDVLQDDARVSCGVIRQEVERFLDQARQRGESDGEQRRKVRRRGRQSWPLLVSFGGRPMDRDHRATLHDASEQGIAFLLEASVPVGTTVYMKLFASMEFCPRVPAVVKHATRRHGGYLVGCAYLLEDAVLCERALELGRHSRHSRARSRQSD